MVEVVVPVVVVVVVMVVRVVVVTRIKLKLHNQVMSDGHLPASTPECLTA